MYLKGGEVRLSWSSLSCTPSTDSGLVCPPIRSSLSFSFTHSFNTYVSASPKSQVPSCGLHLSNTSSHLVLVHDIVQRFSSSANLMHIYANQWSVPLHHLVGRQIHHPVCTGLTNWREMETFSNQIKRRDTHFSSEKLTVSSFSQGPYTGMLVPRAKKLS